MARFWRLARSRHLHRASVALTLVVVLGVVDYERYLSGSDLRPGTVVDVVEPLG